MEGTMTDVRLETKTVQARVLEAKADGTATALVSVFGNVDLGGDRVMPGAFTATLDAWRQKGDPIPVIWSHDWDNPESFVGWADPKAIEESDAGLVVPMQFDLDRPRAEQVHHLLKTRRVTQFSFGYFAKEYQDVQDPDYGPVRELTAVDLFEVGPTLLGMNPETELLQAASALRDRKAGRVLSAKNEDRIRGAYDALGEVLATLQPEEPKAAPAGAKAAPAGKAIDVPAYVADNAARGLAYYEEGYGGDGLVEQTIRDARDMASGTVREEKVRLMGPWIARHIVDLDAPQNSDPQADGYPGPGLVAMLLWGAGPDAEGARRTQAWAEGEAARLDEKASEPATKELDESAHPATSRQRAIYSSLETIAETFGKFDQTTGPDGAHYVGADANPFAAEGMQCANCVFYEGPRACEIVDGDIDPAAVCKFWVIPADLMAGDAPPADGPESASATSTDSPALDAGDNQGTIPSEQVTALLTRTRHSEE